MSKIQIAELQEVNSELNLLSDRETSMVVGGYRNYFGNFDFTNIIQINSNINVQIAFNGDNFNLANLNNNANAS
ncbi:MAG: hypothetical protein QNJ53_23500 [Pleurocapsa sp. MO_192.B19]|nr:hypothetical protein [Pleurocapsa sp. MO_192.B19]